MKTGRIVGAALLAALLLPLVPRLSESAVAKQELGVDTFTVADRRGDQLRPRLAGNLVVWQDYRDLPDRSGDELNADIYARDLRSNVEIRVSDSHTSSRPDVSGDLIVFADNRNGDADIRAYDVRRDESYWIERRSGSAQDRPSIDGNLVVWQDNRDGSWDIRARDLSNDEDFWVSRRDDNQINPRVSGRIVVWEDDRDGCCDIYARDLDSGDVTGITDENDAHDPDVSGRWVVYRRGDGDRTSIYAYHLDRQETVRLNSSREDTRGEAAVSGSLVIWADRRNEDHYNLYAYDLERGTEYDLLRSDNDKIRPAISGNRVVWSELRGDRGWQIRGADLTLPAAEPTPTPTASPSPTLPAPPVSGGPPPGPCYFTLGFKMLRDMIPSAVGDCRENEWHDAFNGDGLQQTTGGLLVWRKADNWTAFTNGSITWLNGPCGLQTRPNDGQPYSWEGRVGAPCS
jgi:beta propeller repeat protein